MTQDIIATARFFVYGNTPTNMDIVYGYITDTLAVRKDTVKLMHDLLPTELFVNVMPVDSIPCLYVDKDTESSRLFAQKFLDKIYPCKPILLLGSDIGESTLAIDLGFKGNEVIVLGKNNRRAKILLKQYNEPNQLGLYSDASQTLRLCASAFKKVGTAPLAKGEYRFDGLVIDTDLQTVTNSATDQTVNITPQEAALLNILLQNEDRAVNRSALIAAITKENTDEKIVDVIKCKMVAKIAAIKPDFPGCVQTLWKMGYAITSQYKHMARLHVPFGRSRPSTRHDLGVTIRRVDNKPQHIKLRPVFTR